MQYEIHYMKIIEAESFFDAVDWIKQYDTMSDKVLSVSPYYPDELELEEEE